MTERSETERAELVDKITQAEVAQIFGDMMPAEAAVLLMNPGDRTTDQLREALRSLAAQDQKPVAWLQSSGTKTIVSQQRLDMDASRYGWTEKPLYLSPPPAAGWDQAIEAALSTIRYCLIRYYPHNSNGEILQHQIDLARADVIEAIEALRHNAPPDSGAGKSDYAPVVSIQQMRLSDGRTDYFVSIKVGDREVTPHVFREEYKSAYHVALYSWLLNGTEKPDLIAFGPDEWPAVAKTVALPDHGGADAGVKAQIATLAQRFWTIHPRELQDKGMTREEFYIREMTSLVAALSKPAPVAANASAEAEEEEEFYEIGLRDGYEDAIQDLDIATGGDGEFKGSSIPGETVDVPAMRARIISRLSNASAEARLRWALKEAQRFIASDLDSPPSVQRRRDAVWTLIDKALSVHPYTTKSEGGLNEQARNPVRLPDGSGDLASAGGIARDDIKDHHRQVGGNSPSGRTSDVMEGWTGQKCPYCKGTGENLSNPMNSGACNKCGGTGDEYAALSAHPHASDCDKHGLIEIGPFQGEMKKPGPSDRTADDVPAIRSANDWDKQGER